MRLFDTHVHLDAGANVLAPGELVERAAAVGVTDLLLVGVEPDNWARCATIAHAMPSVHLGLGIHPQAVRGLDDATIDDALERLPALLRQTGAVAVGEIGLDYLWDKDPIQRQRQRDVLIRQLDMAVALDLPVSLHALRSLEPLLALWRAHPARRRLPAILHSFSGSAEQVPMFAAEGLCFAFSGSVTWTGARRTPNAARVVPDELLLLETDAPYQPPHPLEPGPCRPDHLAQVLQRVAELRGASPEHIAELTWANARRTLRLDGPIKP